VQTAVTNLVTTGARVDRGRAEEIPAESTPALRVRMGADPIVDPWAHQLLDSDLNIVIAAKVHEASTNVETKLNLVRKEVTIALAADPTLGLAFVHALIELGPDEPQISGELAKPTGTMDMRYLCRYRRSRMDPSA
jgi:hypothetical protein